ncbi:hypothetical protein Tco_0211166 [Tanacetum coccineum]
MLCGSPPMKASINFSAFGTMFGHKTANSWNLLMSSSRSGVPIGITVHGHAGYGMIHEDGDNDAISGNDDERAIIEEEDEEQIRFLGGNSSSGTKKYQGSNSNDGGNTGDGVKIAGGVIGSGDEIELLLAEAGK